MSVIAIIPARGGSKGIPRKNLRRVAGRTLIARAIEAARGAKCVSRVVVTTDDAQIAVHSEALGAEVVIRPAEISGDEATSEEALLQVMETLFPPSVQLPETLVFIQCTAPFTLPEDIDGAVGLLEDHGADSVVVASASHGFLWTRSDKGAAHAINHDPSIRQRRQDGEPQFLESGSVYVMRVQGFLEHRHRFFGRTMVFEIPMSRNFEVDDPVDLIAAQAIGEWLELEKRFRRLPKRIGAVVFDFDGVFTDNRVHVSQNGIESVSCHRGDGMGIASLKARQIPICVMSSEANSVVRARCKKLDIECRDGLREKVSVLREWVEHNGIDIDEVVYLGNDVNDLECLQAVGCGVVVADAHASVRDAASIVLCSAGGQGAIRELADAILAQIDRDR